MNPRSHCKWSRWFGLLGCVWLSLGALPAVAKPSAAKADALLKDLMASHDPGLAVLVAQDGEILLEKGYGLADMEQQVPVLPRTTFLIGSITKQFTAAAILKLQEEGKLGVDDKLSKYLPDFPRGDEVTLRELLTHTSGIHSYTEKPDFGNRSTNATPSEAIIAAMKQDTYDFDPGAEWRYDNAGYRLLGYIVEKVSGQSYGDFLRANFFRPLGMTNTGIFGADHGLPHAAVGYSLGTNGFRPARKSDMSWWIGAGAICSTVEDLYRWNEGLFNGRALDAASLRAAFTPVKEDKAQINTDAGYGFGWEIRHVHGMLVIWHNGGLDGFCSLLVRVPDKKLTVAILANAEPGRTNAIPERLAARLLHIFLAGQGALPPTVNKHVSPQSFDALTGLYKLSAKIVTSSKRRSHLYVQVGDEPEMELFPETETNFFSQTDCQIMFVKDGRGKASRLIFRTADGIELLAPRCAGLAEAKVDPAVYDSLVGRYDYGGLAMDGDGRSVGALTVTRAGKHLFAHFGNLPNFEIFPQSETEYFCKTVDLQLTFVKDAAGKVTKVVHHQNGQTIDAPKIP